MARITVEQWWLIAAALVVGAAVEWGRRNTQGYAHWSSILVDNRLRYSLSRLQIVLWTILVLSLLAAVFLTRHFAGVSYGDTHNSMSIVIPGEPAEACFREFERFARQTLEPEMRAVHPDTGIEFEIRAQVPAFQATGDDPAVILASQLTGQNGLESVPYGAEAGQFQEAGHSVVMCGPGSIDQAHQPNEFISIEQLEAGTAFARRLIEQLS